MGVRIQSTAPVSDTMSMNRINATYLAAFVLACALAAGWGFTAITVPYTEPIAYNEDIRPIFNSKCIACHGGVKQSGGLSLLLREEALLPLESGAYAIVPGRPEESELIRRIAHDDPEERMPLDHPPLDDREIDRLEQWIAEGAQWETHWAYLKPEPTLHPPNERSDWVRNGIDAFILARLEEEGLSPSPEASRDVLIRRLSLDLIGLPPTLAEVQRFLDDTAPGAYERLVERLLASPHFGERWASMWMDLARYGDSQGYQKDPGRTIWPYRDWVINALNEDMPFDQFTIEQLAGDLLPDPDRRQLLATAFHRNTMSNDEGGTDDEEFRVAAVLDRVNTTFEVWQGTTIGCVQCHSHPYDPFMHDEYYELFAFFNNTKDEDKPHERPVLRSYSPMQEDEVRETLRWFDEQCGAQYLENHGTLEAARDALFGDLKRKAGPCAKVVGDSAWTAHVRELERLEPPGTPIMQDFPPDSSRITRIFERGNWLVHGDTVQPDVPASLPNLPASYPRNRLGLARWLVHQDNPLTARVIINRFWEQLFGIGIVETLEDFGSQGEPPSHPELLDWLAVQFMHEHQWSVKSLLKSIVLSSTYRQASIVTPGLIDRDPQNRLLARGPRFRLSAEQLRDQALAVGGLLNRKQYGPSVMPPQPEGTWQVIRGVMKWETARDEDRFRRALYTFWRRSSPYPSMITFDTPSREYCVSRRIRTNTPLQALVSLNDVVFIEAAVGLAHRMQRSAPENSEKQLVHGYRLALASYPSEQQLARLVAFYETTLAHYRDHPEAIRELVPDSLSASPQTAALINSANVIMNLDAFLNKS